MRKVVFVAPYLAETTLRFVAAVARLPEATMALVTQDPIERVPAELRGRIAAYHQTRNGLDSGEIRAAVAQAHQAWGGLDRLVGTLEELQVPLGQMRDELEIPGMGEAAARNFRDKGRMKERLREAGLPCARHAVARTEDEARAFAAAVGYPLIVKPPAGSGARSTFRIENPADLSDCLRAMRITEAQPALLEEFVTGEERTFDGMSLGGKLVWYSINHYLPTPLEVLREPWIQWCVLLPRETDDPTYDQIRPVATKALEVLGMDTGLSHMEWFLRPNGEVAISEVGARPPGARFVNLISWAHDFDLFEAWAKAVVHGAFDPRPRPYASGAVYLRAQGSGGRVRRVRGLELLQELGELVVEARVPKIGQSPTGTYEGEGYVILRDPSTDRVKDGLKRILNGLRVELDQ